MMGGFEATNRLYCTSLSSFHSQSYLRNLDRYSCTFGVGETATAHERPGGRAIRLPVAGVKRDWP